MQLPRWIAHRGGGDAAPENTIAAIECGARAGFVGVEFDVMLSADGVPVLMHDERLGRTVAGRGRVADLPAEELVGMDAGSRHSPAFAGVKVPTFRQAWDRCAELGLWMNVEIKPDRRFQRRTGEVVASLARARAREAGWSSDRLPLLSSFSLQALEAAGVAAADLPRGLLLAEWRRDWRALARALDVVSVHVDHRILTEARAAAVKSCGLGLFCYTVNHPDRARELLRWGVDALCTDRLDLPAAVD